jgi:hypothetical protein
MLLYHRTPVYRGTSLIKDAHPPRTPLRPYAQAYGRVLGGCVFLWAWYTCKRSKQDADEEEKGTCLFPELLGNVLHEQSPRFDGLDLGLHLSIGQLQPSRPRYQRVQKFVPRTSANRYVFKNKSCWVMFSTSNPRDFTFAIFASTCQRDATLLPNNQHQHRTCHIQKDVLLYALC